MECIVSGNQQIKSLNRAVICLARIGSELVIEALPDEIKFRTLNSSSSAHLTIVFRRQFFDEYYLPRSRTQCSVLLKSVCTVFRTPPSSMDRLSMTLPHGDATKLQWTLDCRNGIRKTYWIACNQDAEIQDLNLGRDRLPSHIVVKPRDFNRLLSNFQSSLQELTLIATEPISTPPDSETTVEAKAVELRSYIDPAKDSKDGALHTQLWIDPLEELQEYCHVGVAVDVTFSIKEVKSFIAFCEGSDADLHLHFEKAGDPIILAPRFGLDNAAESDFDATLVLATMLGSQLRGGEGLQPAAQPVAGSVGRNGSTSQVQNVAGAQRTLGSRSSTPGSHQPSDHTVIWSDMTASGSAGRRSQNNDRTSHRGVPLLPDTGNASEEIDFTIHRQRRNNVPIPEKIYSRPLPPEAVSPAQGNHLIDGAVSQTQTRNLRNWVGGDAEEDEAEDDEDNELVQSTPPHRRGPY